MGVPGSANFLLAGAQGYQIERSLRFNSADSAYLNRTPASAGSQTTWSWSGWIKRSALSATTYRLFGTGDNNSAANQTSINLSSDSLDFYNVNGGNKTTTAKFRDPSAWYHVVVVWDSNNATASDRIRLYVNGTRLTAFSSSTDPSSGTNTVVNSAVSHTIGTLPTNSGNYFDGYLTEINFIDGQALTPSSFGETNPVTGVWQPKRYSGTYGTNGFYLKFADNSGTTSTTLGKDSSGNGNNWTPNNFSVTAGAGNDSMIDTPTPYADGGNGRGNYCTWNPLKTGTNLSPEDGNLFARMQSNGSGINQSATATIYVSSGKWYWEGTSYNTVSGYGQIFGIASTSFTSLNSSGSTNQTYGYEKDGTKNNGTTSSSYGASYTSNDVIGVALDLDAGALVFYKNGTSQGTAFTGLSGTFTPYCGLTYSGGGPGFYTNFGQRPFAYTPPSGFLALNTQNLPEPTIKKPSSYMDVVTYTGTGSALTPTSSLGFSPDLVWVKSRSAATDHAFYDAVRGAEKRLESSNTDAEITSDGGVTAFNSAGFTLGTLAQVNTNAATYAAWCWDESATPGFDIVTYTGTGVSRTVSHTLGTAPAMMIVKKRNTAASSAWVVYHQKLTTPSTDYLRMELTDGSATAASVFGAAPTSSVFTVGTDSATNGNADTFVAYLWSEVAGFSKFGSYTGNGSTDGPFVACNFRPRWVMIKRTDSAGNFWTIRDTARNTYNVADLQLYPNSSFAESSPSTVDLVDIVSNGFKIRGTSSDVNASGGTYIFCAFAETPAKYSLAR